MPKSLTVVAFELHSWTDNVHGEETFERKGTRNVVTWRLNSEGTAYTASSYATELWRHTATADTTLREDLTTNGTAFTSSLAASEVALIAKLFDTYTDPGGSTEYAQGENHTLWLRLSLEYDTDTVMWSKSKPFLPGTPWTRSGYTGIAVCPQVDWLLAEWLPAKFVARELLMHPSLREE